MSSDSDPSTSEFRQQLFVIGIAICVIALTTVFALVMRAMRSASVPAEKFLTRERQTVLLMGKTRLSHDTVLFRFGLPQDLTLGLPCGQHIKIFCPNPNAGKTKGTALWNDKDDPEVDDEIERKYTPTSTHEDVGHFDLVVKIYKPMAGRFTNGGKASQYLDTLKIGDELSISGPWGTITYEGVGVFKKMKKSLAPCKRIGMIAGGTGITPMLQIIENILNSVNEEEEEIEIKLIFGNQTESDILLRERLTMLSNVVGDERFHVHFVLDKVDNKDTWKGGVGYVTKEMIQAHLFQDFTDSVVLLCGPPIMCKVQRENLLALNCAADRILEF